MNAKTKGAIVLTHQMRFWVPVATWWLYNVLVKHVFYCLIEPLIIQGWSPPSNHPRVMIGIVCWTGKLICVVVVVLRNNVGNFRKSWRMSAVRTMVDSRWTCVCNMWLLSCGELSKGIVVNGLRDGRTSDWVSKCSCAPVLINQSKPNVMGNNWRANT